MGRKNKTETKHQTCLPQQRCGQVQSYEHKGKYRLFEHGFDYYNTKTGGIESGCEPKIAVWLLDTDFNGHSLYPRQVFLPMDRENEYWAKLAKNLKTEIDEKRIEAYCGTVFLPFELG